MKKVMMNSRLPSGLDTRPGEVRERAADSWRLQHAATRADLSRRVAARGWRLLPKFLDRRAAPLAGHTVGRGPISNSSRMAAMETGRVGKRRPLRHGSSRLWVPDPRRSGHRAGPVGGSKRLFAINARGPHCGADMRGRILY